MVQIHKHLSDHLVEALNNCIKAIEPYCHRTEEQKKQAEEKAAREKEDVTGGPAELLAELKKIQSRKELMGTELDYERLCGLETMCIHFLRTSNPDEHRYPKMNPIRRCFTELSRYLGTAIDLRPDNDRFPGHDIGVQYFRHEQIRLRSAIGVIVENIRNELAVTPERQIASADLITEGEAPAGFAAKCRISGMQLSFESLLIDSRSPKPKNSQERS